MYVDLKTVLIEYILISRMQLIIIQCYTFL